MPTTNSPLPTVDHPHVRASRVCPLCNGAKDDGLIVCWTCYRSHDVRNGLRAYASVILDAVESAFARKAGRDK